MRKFFQLGVSYRLQFIIFCYFNWYYNNHYSPILILVYIMNVIGSKYIYYQKECSVVKFTFLEAHSTLYLFINQAPIHNMSVQADITFPNSIPCHIYIFIKHNILRLIINSTTICSVIFFLQSHHLLLHIMHIWILF